MMGALSTVPFGRSVAFGQYLPWAIGVVLEMIEGRIDARTAVGQLLNRPMKEES